jgi:hypothetical protein
LRFNTNNKGGDFVDNQKGIPNRLINESSPYFLQHANNPVDWFPWGEEAFEKARGKTSLFFYLLGIADLSTMMNLSLVPCLQKHVYNQ